MDLSKATADAEATICETCGISHTKRNEPNSCAPEDGSCSQSKPPEATVKLNKCAITLFEQGDLQRASSMIQEAAQEWNGGVSDRIKWIRQEEAVQQRPSSVEYDEGMDIFQGPEEIPSNCHQRAAVAILLFNAGQVERKLHRIDSAFTYYQMALDEILPCIAGNGPESSQEQKPRQVLQIVIPLLHNLGQIQYRRKQNDEAIAFYEFALQESRQSVETHEKASFYVAATLNCLGMVNQQHLEKSVRYFQEALTTFANLFGPDSAWVATVLNNLGRVYVATGDCAAALVCFRKALANRQRHFGSCHVDFGATTFNVAQCLHNLGKHDEALVQYQDFLNVLLSLAKQSSSTQQHQHNREIAVVLSCIGQIYHEQGEDERASEFYNQSLILGRQAASMSPQDLAVLLNRIGNFRFDWGNLNGALEAYEEGLAIEQRVLEPNHPNITVTMSNIAEIHRQKGEFSQSLRLYNQAVELLASRHGPESAQVAAALNVVGLIYNQKGDTDMALNTLQQALAIRRTALGDDHIDVASTLLYLGTIFCRKKMLSVALRLLMESYRIRKNQLGPNNLFVSYSAYNVALCHQLQGNHSEAVQFFTETLNIQKCLLGKDHKDIVSTLIQIGDSLQADGDVDGALKSFEDALEIKRHTAYEDKDLSALVKILVEIRGLYHAAGQTERLMHVLTEFGQVFRARGLSIHQLCPPPTRVQPHELNNIGPCAPIA